MQCMPRWIFIFLLLIGKNLASQPGVPSEHLKIDQFGYPTYAEKICVINDPVVGFDAPESYTPGATMHVRNATTDALVYSAPITIWNSGNTYDQSGDILWWFNFSAVMTPGSYYIYDPANNTRSFHFDIRDNVYE